ncbi:MAG TPA: hypothetical protein DCZ48_03380, partial [Methylococcaceae bacterium]|nr:hypothetical protein [Methylococcaceae bacterium]
MCLEKEGSIGVTGFNFKPDTYDSVPVADRNFRPDYRAAGLKIDVEVGWSFEFSKRIAGIKPSGLY